MADEKNEKVDEAPEVVEETPEEDTPEEPAEESALPVEEVEEYDPLSDPVIPNSVLGEVVAAEMKSGSSPTRDALVAAREADSNN